MKKIVIIIVVILIVLLGGIALFIGLNKNKEPINNSEQLSIDTNTTNTVERALTKEMAYKGVDNYCHRTYDWTVAEIEPSIMYVGEVEETDTEYKVTFHSYTDAFVYFYVNKKSGETRLVEHLPTLKIKKEIETINIFDYLDE